MPAELAPIREFGAILGRPTDRSVAISALSAAATEARVEFSAAGIGARRTEAKPLPAGVAVEFEIDGLRPNTDYTYRVLRRAAGAADWVAGAAGSFHTQRPPGASFTFAVQGDSHPERPQMFLPALYVQTLRAAAADKPDFYLTIGDDFSVDTLPQIDRDAVRQIYLNQRLYLSLVGAPVFLVNGNHEQAALANTDGTADSVGVMTQTARNALFPQPAPDGFYTGNAQPVRHVGLLRNYFAWTWGDALFVVIDPYWHSTQPVDNKLGERGKDRRDLWNITLGDEQYRWLKNTLETSRSKYKFVFAHHVLGTGRGGIERAGLYEWGGRDQRGRDEFKARRPTWELPIHPLMAKTGVTIFFQGHDHLFARQELDGVVYQTLPLPADPYYAVYNRDAYESGDVFAGSGRVRVNVSPAKVTVEYVKSVLPSHSGPDRKDGEVAFRYELPAPPAAAPK
jgi:hypothetical protein